MSIDNHQGEFWSAYRAGLVATIGVVSGDALGFSGFSLAGEVQESYSKSKDVENRKKDGRGPPEPNPSDDGGGKDGGITDEEYRNDTNKRKDGGGFWDSGDADSGDLDGRFPTA